MKDVLERAMWHSPGERARATWPCDPRATPQPSSASPPCCEERPFVFKGSQDVPADLLQREGMQRHLRKAPTTPSASHFSFRTDT